MPEQLNRRGYAPLTLRRACAWKRIAKLGALPSDVTPHTLRHCFASVAVDLGYSEPTANDIQRRLAESSRSPHS